ncbi:MAG: GIN domain-containing protein [Chitinophagaceae bacterium]
MKQKLFLSFMAIAFGVLSASAQNEEKLVVKAGKSEHITVASDMNIVLLAGNESDQSISMDGSASDKLDLKLSNNAMRISSVRQSKKEKLTVYLYVNNLKSITVESNSTVKTIGVLNAPALKAFVDSDAMVHLKTKGDIKAYSLNGGEIRVKYISENLLARQGQVDRK